ncbi:MAG TPA: ATP-binding protein [Actinomycetota bacterium]|nr:ATP-binding protein [Actinomycetota bacterium]
MIIGAPSLVRVPGEHLVGRQRERAVLDRLLEAARGGDGGVLVVHGEPGVGKTALLEYAGETAQGYRVARTSGVEGKMELPFAVLQQLCSPFLGLVERLPQPQRDALGVAFGLRAGAAPNPFLVGLAVLGLLSEAAEDRPAPNCRRRRAVARWRVVARARIRRPPPVGGEDRARVRHARAGRRAQAPTGAPRRALGASRRAGAAGVRLAGSAG